MFNAKLVILSVAFFAIASAAESYPTVQELCALVPGTTILRPNSCTNWIKCPSSLEDLEFEEGSCVFGLYFNKDTGKCQYKNELECPFETTSTVENRCARIADGKFVADESNCNVFIYCHNGQEQRSSCPGDLVFNPETSSCVYKNQYTCPEPKTVKESNPICMSLPNNVYFADQNDCTKYDSCIDGSLSQLNCTEGTGWDYAKGICVPLSEAVCLPTAKKPEPENTICGDNAKIIVGPIPDDISCSGYYYCKQLEDGSADRHPEHYNCESGRFFDETTLSCRDRLSVKCSLDRCEGMENKYVNIAGDCKAYAYCIKGVSTSIGNCPNSYFFDERTQGCTPQVVSYTACSA